MKIHFNLLAALIILSGAFTTVAHAQIATQKVVANVPFAFNVGKTNLPAGKYTITVVNPSSDRKILQIRSSDGKSSAMIMTTGVIGRASDDAKLVFHRYDNRYFFAQAHMAGESTSFAAVKASAEHAQRQAVAKAGKKSVVVIIAE